MALSCPHCPWRGSGGNTRRSGSGRRKCPRCSAPLDRYA